MGSVEHCDECGFVYADLAPSDVPKVLLEGTAKHRNRLTTADRERVRRRSHPGTWSALEYGAHLRDVLLVQRDRLVRALVEDVPSVPTMHRDDRPELVGYADEDPAATAAELGMAADLLVRVWRRLDAGQLDRPLAYNYPE